MIGDRYQPVEQIGIGGMATVWKARDTLLGRLVAVKRLLPHLADDPVASARFRREAQAAASLVHPGIVTVFDSGEDEEGPFIVLELIEGTTLADRLAAVGSLDPGEVIGIVSQVASALDHAHAQGVIHRDIKPANVILDNDGRARVADFGIARAVEDPTTITATGELVGTIAYLAPEILAGETATPASDIYSLGAVTFELLAGSPPYTAESPAALLEAVRTSPTPSLRGITSDQLAAAVSSAMSRDPAARPLAATTFASALIGSAATLVMGPGLTRPPQTMSASDHPTVITSHAAPPPDRSYEPEPSHRGRWAVGAVLVAAVALAAAALGDRVSPEGRQSGAALAAVTSTTTFTTTTTTIPTTTTAPTTTTTLATTTTVHTPETVTGEIQALLATLDPPQFKPKEVRQVEDSLRDAMEAWTDGERDDLARELEDTFDESFDLEPSPERDELIEMLTELAELMGFEVDQRGNDDGDD